MSNRAVRVEAKRGLEDRAWWYSIAAIMGAAWRVYGWNYRHSASLVDERGRHHEVNGAVAEELSAQATRLRDLEAAARELIAANRSANWERVSQAEAALTALLPPRAAGEQADVEVGG